MNLARSMTALHSHRSDDQLRIAVTISADGVIESGGAALRALFSRADFGLWVSDGRVCACDNVAKRLERAVAQLRRNSRPLTLAFPERERCGALILDLYAVGSAPDEQEAATVPRFMGTFRHAASDSLPSSDRISQTLGLSPAEAVLAVALARGVSPDDYARLQGITKNTVRSQLAVVRKKTGAHSQTQIANLVWLLANARV